MSRQWIGNSPLIPSYTPGKSELPINVEKLFQPDPDNPKGDRIYDYSMRYFVGDKIAAGKSVLTGKKKIIFTGRSLNEKSCKFQVALVMRNGTAFGGIVNVDPENKDYELSLADLKQNKLVTLPRPYPTFLPYYFDNNQPQVFDIMAVEALQLSIGPGMSEDEVQHMHGISIESIRLE